MHRSLTLYLLLTLAIPALAHAEPVKVAVTVKPAYSLVSGIMKGIGEPVLIMTTSASPHHYTLRPSERRALSDADLIFWIGSELETFMPRILHSLDRPTTHIALIESAGLVHLPARTTHHHANTQAHTDPHIWLSADNAHVMVDEIASKLTKLDTANTERYETNRKRLHRRINETDVQINRKLSGKTSAFLSYHDAYQYFEQAYGLNNVGFVSSGDEISPSARYVHEIRDLIRNEQLHCLFYEAPNRPALVDTLTRDFAVEAFELDAIGIRLEADENTWFEIMHQLAETYDSCL